MTTDSNSLSIYSGELTKGNLAKQTAKLLQAFPKMPPETIDILKDRFIENGFNDERMIAAVGNVIDNYEGWDKLPNIANFIQFDKKVKLYTYTEFLHATKELSPDLTRQWQHDHVYVKVNGNQVFVSKSDYNNYKHLFE